MQVTVKDVSTVKKILSIEVPEKDVVQELDNAYKTPKDFVLERRLDRFWRDITSKMFIMMLLPSCSRIHL